MKISKAELRSFRSLSQKKVRQTEKKFVLEGWRALKEVLNSSTRMDLVAVLPRFLKDPDYAKLLSDVERRGIPIRELDEIQLNQVADTMHAQGVVAIVQQKSREERDLQLDHASLIVAVDAVSDPGNLGSILRTADWFNADAVLLGRGCVELYNEKVVRSTVGSIFHVPVVESVDLPVSLKELKKKGFRIVGLSGDGKTEYTNRSLSKKEVFVLGSEAHGISKETRAAVDEIVRIPRFGNAESLNVGVACGIILAHARVQQQKKGS
jgi:TrmH family RNA methyltransferase